MLSNTGAVVVTRFVVAGNKSPWTDNPTTLTCDIACPDLSIEGGSDVGIKGMWEEVSGRLTSFPRFYIQSPVGSGIEVGVGHHALRK